MGGRGRTSLRREAGESCYANGHQRLEIGMYFLALLLISYNRATQPSLRVEGQNFPQPKDVKKSSLHHPTSGGSELSVAGQRSVICDLCVCPPESAHSCIECGQRVHTFTSKWENLRPDTQVRFKYVCTLADSSESSRRGATLTIIIAVVVSNPEGKIWLFRS